MADHFFRRPSPPSRSLSLVIWNKNWKSVSSRLQTPYGKKEARSPDENGDLPLHDACSFHAPCHILRSLLHVFPQAARMANSCGFLPLHTACSKRAPARVIQLLLEAYPEGATVKTRRTWGWLPLHFACWHGASPDVVRMLIDQYPYGAAVRDGLGHIPLHQEMSPYADHTQPRAKVVMALLDAYPEGACLSNEYGTTWSKRSFVPGCVLKAQDEDDDVEDTWD